MTRDPAIDRFLEIARIAFTHDPLRRSALFTLASRTAGGWRGVGVVVIGRVLLSRRPTPIWPHVCGVDGEACLHCDRERAADVELEATSLSRMSLRLSLRHLDAFCPDDQGGVAPYAIARRSEGGEPSLEIVGELYRPHLDMPSALEPVPERDDQTRRLLALVYARPDDDAPRRVLADHLQERGDPLGEFISLSFVADADDQVREARARLLEAHGRAWLGPLQAVLPRCGAEFARGFLHRARVHFADEEIAREAGRHVEWATVERLRFSPGGVDHVDPAMRGLRKVGPLAQRGLEALASAPSPWAIERLHARVQDSATLEALHRCWPLLPSLRRLRLSGDGVTPFRVDEMLGVEGPRLEHLAVSVGPGELAASVDAWIGVLRCCPALPEFELSSLTEAVTVAGFQLTWRRDSPAVELGQAALASDATLAQLEEIVRALPRDTPLELRATQLWTPGPEEIEVASTAFGRPVAVTGSVG